MARSTLFKPRWFGWLIHSVNARPVVRGRGPDQDWALFVNLVRKGKALLVFPEGTRTESGELQRGKSGFGRLVHLCQVPVYPAYIEGSYQAFPKGGKYSPLPIRVIFGKAVYLDDLLNQPGEKRIIREISERVLKAISGLKKELERQDRSKL
jgi:1-acyl-sn-glycerol-3-phosphate acyltransferase